MVAHHRLARIFAVCFAAVATSPFLGLLACNAAVVVTAERILNAASAAITVMQALKQSTREESLAMAMSFQQIKTEIPNRQIEQQSFARMEGRLKDLREGHNRLTRSLSEANDRISEYLNLLKARVNQNKTPELRNDLLARLAQKKSDLDFRMVEATRAITALEAAIQRYDDIVGYLQVRDSLVAVGEQLASVTRTVYQANQLTRDADVAISEGIRIINELGRNDISERPLRYSPGQPEAQRADPPIPQAGELGQGYPSPRVEVPPQPLVEPELAAATPPPAPMGRKVPYLGIEFGDPPKGLIGVAVRALDNDGPANDFLTIGDVITAADGLSVRRGDDLLNVIRKHVGEAPIPLTVIRDGEFPRVIRIKPVYRVTYDPN